jgi:phosphatidylinositol 4-kinase A
MASDIRAKALQKIAALSAASSSSFDRSDLDRLCRACHSGGRAKEFANGGPAKSLNSLGKVPMVC